MEIFGKITTIDATVTGTSSNTGNTWSRTSVEITEVGGSYPSNMRFDIFGDHKHLAKQGITLGAVGTMRYECHVEEYNGKRFNRFSRVNFSPYMAQQPPKTETEAYMQNSQATANAAAASTAPSAPAVAPAEEKKEEGDGLPF